ncbi:MAG: cation:proton antiporter [Candidatus Gracilibacteria bacterium]|nr:cation:proton antiporter [Candidatus Gracilibacteria bacterium]
MVKLHSVAMISACLLLFYPISVFAAGPGEAMPDISFTLLGIAVILIAAKISNLIERFGQPPIVGELLVGVLLGNLSFFGLHVFEDIRSDNIINFLGELGVIILLFQVGLESNIEKIRKVCLQSFVVAFLGVIIPFVLGTYVVGPWLLPDLSFNTYLFLGATLTATSVGITARVFKDLNKIHIPEAQIVLGAAVIDDVIGLIILAVVSTIATVGGVGLGLISWIAAKAILFLLGSIILGQVLAPKIGKLLSKINTGVGMKFTLAISFCLVFAFLAQKVGLTPIVGAFSAGLILDPVHFSYFKDPKIVRDIKEAINDYDHDSKEKILSVIAPHAKRHIEDLIAPIGLFLIPIFFVITGMNVKLETMFNLPILLVALGLTAAAFVGKIVSGLAVRKANKFLVGFGMVPRGEVGLIFAMTGKALNIIPDEVFSTIVIMVILTTLLTPPILTSLLKKQDKLELKNK